MGDTSHASGREISQGESADPVLSLTRTYSPFHFSPSMSTQVRRKTGVIAELSDSLRDVLTYRSFP